LFKRFEIKEYPSPFPQPSKSLETKLLKTVFLILASLVLKQSYKNEHEFTWLFFSEALEEEYKQTVFLLNLFLLKTPT